MTENNVHFLPSKKNVNVPLGETVLHAAERAGFNFNALCGGEGICGECRARIVEGKHRKGDASFFTEEEIKAGWVLACQTPVEGPLTVLEPGHASSPTEMQ